MAKKPTQDEVEDPSKFVQEELLPQDPRDAMTAATFHEETGEQVNSSIGKDGKEYPDPVPIAPPIDYVPPPTLMDMIRRMVHSERLAQLAHEEEFDSVEEADDFDIEDDPMDPLTPYERHFFPSENTADVRATTSPPAPPSEVPGTSPQAPPAHPAGSNPPPAAAAAENSRPPEGAPPRHVPPT